MAAAPEVVIDYAPHPDGTVGPNEPQRRAHMTDAEEILYGGAAGGGKTAWGIAEVLAVAFEFPGINIGIIRRSFPQLNELGGIAWTLRERIPLSLGKYNEQKTTWTLTNGSKIKLGYLERDADVSRWQGSEYGLLFFDQVEQISEFAYLYVCHRLRVSGKMKAMMDAAGYSPRAICTANPGGRGHGWVKRRWIDAHPKGNVVWQPEATEQEPNPGTRCFIPARIWDNLDNLHESYIRRLQALPDDMRRAMLYGDWSVFAGQMFRTFNPDIHVIPQGLIPMHVIIPQRRAMGIDYGMEAPFCCLWGAKMPDNVTLVYRELYRNNLTPEEQADLILASEWTGERSPGRGAPGYLDPSTWIRNPNDLTEGDPTTGAPPPSSIAGIYARRGVPVTRANNNRLAGVARVHEKLQMRPDKTPRMYITDNCVNLIRTLPELVHDDKHVEDVDTDGEDHCLVGGTLVETMTGSRRIDSLVGEEGWCRDSTGGWVRYHSVRPTRVGEVMTVMLADGRSVTATPDHRMLTPEGWVEIKDLSPGSVVLCGTSPSSSARPSRSTEVPGSTCAVDTSRTKVADSTSLSIGTTMVRSRRVATSIMSISTPPTIIRPTWRYSSPPSTSHSTGGTLPRRSAEPGARTPFPPLSAIVSSLQINGVRRLVVGGLTYLSTRSNAVSVALGSLHRFRVGRASAVGRVEPVLVASVSGGVVEQTFDLSVDSTSHAFMVNGGVIVSNCFDALRYLLFGLEPITATATVIDSAPPKPPREHERQVERHLVSALTGPPSGNLRNKRF